MTTLSLLTSNRSCEAAQRVEAKIPVEAAAIACKYAQSLPPEEAASKRWVWCPNWWPNETHVVTIVQNVALNQSPVDVRTLVLGGGSVGIIDLRKLAPDDEAYAKIVKQWASLSDREPWFHVKRRVKRAVTSYRAADGKTYDYEWVEASVAADHLGDFGPLMETLAGNPHPESESYCPMVNVGWFTKELLGTADGKRYYDFRGITDDLTLEQYLQKRGISLKQIRELGSDERAAFISRVTAKGRSVEAYQGQGTRPSVGPQLTMVTNDPFDEEDGDAAFDPFRQLLDAKTNGHEVLLTLPNGWVEYSIWNGDGKRVTEAPGALVTNHRIPEPFTDRLEGAYSCMICHGPESNWQSFVNEVSLMIGDRLRVYGDATVKDQDEVLERLAGLYTGDLSWAVKLAQDNFDRRVFSVTKMSAADAMAAVGTVINGYEYEFIDSRRALKEIGVDTLDDGDKNGVITFRRVVPVKDAQGRVPDDPIIGRFHIEYPDVKRKERVGLIVTRRQFEKVIPDLLSRAYGSKN